MKTLIVYYSLGGNTDWAANRVGAALGADLLRIEPVSAYPTGGFRKFFWGGKSAVMAETPPLKPYDVQLDGYGRVIFGFPVWAGNVTPPIRSFIKENDLSGKRIAAFACQSGAGAEKAFAKLRACLGADALEAELILIDPKDKPSAENERRMAAFIDALKK